MKLTLPLFVPALLLTGCGRLDAILFDPPTAPEQWCKTRPCVELAEVVLDQPLGTFLVYLLAALGLVAAWHFWRNRGKEKSRFWWAWALTLGGIAAGLAGTSYQAFGYELKCAGRELCVWTDWFEVAYMVLQNASVVCLIIAVAHACSGGGLRALLIKYAWANAAAHVLVTIYGVATATAFLLSFELLLLFALPALLTALGLNAVRYLRYRDEMDLALLGAWVWLFATNAIYFAYLMAGFTQILWRDGSGFYFSENDVLHVGMIGWMLYLIFVVAGRVTDCSETAE